MLLKRNSLPWANSRGTSRSLYPPFLGCKPLNYSMVPPRARGSEPPTLAWIFWTFGHFAEKDQPSYTLHIYIYRHLSSTLCSAREQSAAFPPPCLGALCPSRHISLLHIIHRRWNIRLCTRLRWNPCSQTATNSRPLRLSVYQGFCKNIFSFLRFRNSCQLKRSKVNEIFFSSIEHRRTRNCLFCEFSMTFFQFEEFPIIMNSEQSRERILNIDLQQVVIGQ